MSRWIVLSALTATVLAAWPQTTSAQSFNCNRAREPAEIAICDSDVLSELDERMAAAYARAMRSNFGFERSRIQSEQAFWLSRRNGCVASAVCIENSYRFRLRQLANE